MATEIDNNRLESTTSAGWQKRLTNDVVVPLVELANRQIPQATTALNQARRGEESGHASLAAAIHLQQETVKRIRAILDHMIQAEGFQEAVNLLQAIQQAQAEVNDQTNRARQERIKRILEGAQPEQVK